MITISGIYDGIQIVPLEEIPTHEVSKVRITFLDDSSESREEEMHHFASTMNFNFWGNEREEMDSLDEK